MTKLGKLLLILAFCCTLTDCVGSVDTATADKGKLITGHSVYPMTVTAKAATGQVHSTIIVVQFIGLKK